MLNIDVIFKHSTIKRSADFKETFSVVRQRYKNRLGAKYKITELVMQWGISFKPSGEPLLPRSNSVSFKPASTNSVLLSMSWASWYDPTAPLAVYTNSLINCLSSQKIPAEDKTQDRS